MPEVKPPPTIDLPTEDDARDIGPMQLRAWHETYVDEGLGIDALWIDTHVSFVVDRAATDFRTQVFRRQAADRPAVLYRTVHVDGEVCGFLHAEGDRSSVTLEGLYLLDPLKGTGVADRLMTVFDTWSAGRPARLDVMTHNERAVRFYARHGFVASGEQNVWKDIVHSDPDGEGGYGARPESPLVNHR